MNLESTEKIKGFNPLNSFIVVVSKQYVTVINAHETKDYLKPKEALDYVIENAGKGHKGGHFEVTGRGDDVIDYYKSVVVLFDGNSKVKVTRRALCSFEFRFLVKPYLSEAWFQDLVPDGFFGMTLEHQINYAYKNIENTRIVKQFFLAYKVELMNVQKKHLRDPRWLELQKVRENVL